MKKTLVFQANNLSGIEYIKSANERGESIVAASSERDFDAEIEIGKIFYLPFINDPAILDSLDELLQKYNITSVYAPVISVFNWFSQIITEKRFKLNLSGTSSINREVQSVRQVILASERFKPFIATVSGNLNQLSGLEIASIFRLSDRIFGESNRSKIAAIIAIFASAPKGDVVELGALVGRSASVLCVMAKRYKIGSVLVIDPWLADNAAQLDSPATLRVDVDGVWENELLTSFFTNMIPLSDGAFNYLRMTGHKGIKQYLNSDVVVSVEFGSVKYKGEISIIHIDGNHDYSEVLIDCEDWIPCIKANGWLILDDYLWSHGDGPKRVGDSIIFNPKRAIKLSFVYDKALFIQFE